MSEPFWSIHNVSTAVMAIPKGKPFSYRFSPDDTAKLVKKYGDESKVVNIDSVDELSKLVIPGLSDVVSAALTQQYTISFVIVASDKDANTPASAKIMFET